GRRGAGADGVGEVVRAVVFVLPYRLAVGGVEAQDALFAFELDFRLWTVDDLTLLDDVVGEKHPPTRDGRAGIAAADGDAPLDRRPVLGELFQDATFAPHAVALRPHPLRPIVAPDGGRA